MTCAWRSLLFVAADDQRRIAKVMSRGADAVILDLEDAVSDANKAGARKALPDIVDMLAGQGELLVRVNSAWLDMLEDLAVAVRPGVSAIMVPKVESAGRLTSVSEIVEALAARAGMPSPPGLVALMETAEGLAQLDEIAAVPGLVALALGTEDFANSMGVKPTPALLGLPCQKLALASARRGILAFGLPVSIATIEDEAAWSAAVDSARSLGLDGALCVHPRQVALVNSGFMPGREEFDFSTRLLAAWTSAGCPAVFSFDGKWSTARSYDRPK